MIWIDGAFTTKKTLTGVQRYAREVTGGFSRLAYEFQIATPGAWSALPGGVQLWEQFRLPQRLSSGDTLFAPCNVAPWRLTRRVRLAVTIHCFRFLYHPESYSRAFLRYYRYAIPRVIRRADLIFTVSECMKQQIESHFPEATGKIHAVPLGISSDFRPVSPGEQEQTPYWLFVGNATAAKNLQLLCEALRGSAELRNIPLKILGTPLPAYAQGLNAEAIPGESDPVNVARRYRNALAIVVPSLYESFSLPVLEGLASGIPAIVSDIPAHRELAGETALYFDPHNATQLRKTLERVVADAGLRTHLSALGIERARPYTWERCARTTWERLHE